MASNDVMDFLNDYVSRNNTGIHIPQLHTTFDVDSQLQQGDDGKQYYKITQTPDFQGRYSNRRTKDS